MEQKNLVMPWLRVSLEDKPGKALQPLAVALQDHMRMNPPLRESGLQAWRLAR